MRSEQKFMSELHDVSELIEAYKAEQLQAQPPLPPMTQNEIIQLGLDVIQKMEKYPFAMRCTVMMLISHGDERTMRAVQKWLESVSPGEPNREVFSLI